MTKQEYRSLLGQLPIKNPTRQDMARLCPHLTEAEAVAEFTTGSRYVACPPLSVRNGFQILSYCREWIEETGTEATADGTAAKGRKNHPATLTWAYTGRTPASYAPEIRSRHERSCTLRYAYTEKAIQFAEANWPEELVLDSWETSLEICIQDPTDLLNDRHFRDRPRTKAVLYIALNRNMSEIESDRSAPKSRLLDDAIAHMTLDIHVAQELRGERCEHVENNCAHCAAGLGISSCPGCGYKFHDDQGRTGWATPLSPRMVAFLQMNGCKFPINPEIARLAERRRFEEKAEAMRWSKR